MGGDDGVGVGMTPTVQLADFGLASDAPTMTGFRTTPTIAPPEMILCEAYDRRCDLWALGVLVYLLTYTKFPFK